MHHSHYREVNPRPQGPHQRIQIPLHYIHTLKQDLMTKAEKNRKLYSLGQNFNHSLEKSAKYSPIWSIVGPQSVVSCLVLSHPLSLGDWGPN